MPATTRLIYIHDPMCSWCWGFKANFTRLRRQLPTDMAVDSILGGLAPDSDKLMPTEMQTRLHGTWRQIQDRIPGTQFNFDFWRDCRPRRSTWPACRAVLATRAMDASLEQDMIEAIQHAYYQQARNPSDTTTLVELAEQLRLDRNAFGNLLDAPQTHRTLAEEIAFARQIGAVSLPSLRLQTGETYWPISIDYTETGSMLEAIHLLVAR